MEAEKMSVVPAQKYCVCSLKKFFSVRQGARVCVCVLRSRGVDLLLRRRALGVDGNNACRTQKWPSPKPVPRAFPLVACWPVSSSVLARGLGCLFHSRTLARLPRVRWFAREDPTTRPCLCTCFADHPMCCRRCALQLSVQASVPRAGPCGRLAMSLPQAA